jgi:hypothetical protein
MLLHLFPAVLKQRLESCKSKTDDVLGTTVKGWLKEQDAEFYGQGIEELIPQYDKYLSVHGDYTEK